MTDNHQRNSALSQLAEEYLQNLTIADDKQSTAKPALQIPALFNSAQPLSSGPAISFGELGASKGPGTRGLLGSSASKESSLGSLGTSSDLVLPDLFGKKKYNSYGNSASINLSQALKLPEKYEASATGTKLTAKPDRLKASPKEQELYGGILDDVTFLQAMLQNKSSASVQPQPPSKIGKIICQQSRKKQMEKSFIQISTCSSSVRPFLFDTDSPDDLVLKAQSRILHRAQ